MPWRRDSTSSSGAAGAPGQTILLPGEPGEDSYVPGPAGTSTPGAPGVAGEAGPGLFLLQGADYSIDDVILHPGPQGVPGTPGADGAAASPVVLFSEPDDSPPILAQPGSLSPIRNRNASIAAQGPGFAVDTYITDSSVFLPSAGGLAPRTMFRWDIGLSKTAAGIALPILNVRIGTAGAIGDAAILTFTSVSPQTAVTDAGVLTILAVLRSTGAAGVLTGSATLVHFRAANVGLGGDGGSVVTSVGFATTTANLFAGVSVNYGLNAAVTVTYVQASVVQAGGS